jgi:membrane associated rhomboid family serine protease
MKRAWNAIVGPLGPGTRAILLVLLLSNLIALATFLSGNAIVYNLFSLTSTRFWSGQIWRVLTYAFLPATMVDFVINGAAVGMLSWWMERAWSRREIWLYCLICAVGTGLCRVLLLPHSSAMMVSSLGVIFGLLVAWSRLFGNDRVIFMGVWEINIRQAAWLFAIIDFLIMLPCGGLINALIMTSGGLVGGIYIFLRTKIAMSSPGQMVEAKRISRLEI